MRYIYLLCCLGVTILGQGSFQELAAQSPDCPNQPTGQGAYLTCQLDQPPRPVLDPSGLTDMGYSACSGVEFHMIVGRDGGVTDVAVSNQTAGARLCERFARDWKFSPGVRAGRNVDVRMTAVLEYDVPSQKDLIWDPVIEWRERDEDYLLKLTWDPPVREMTLPLSALDSALASVMLAVAAHGKIDELDHYCIDLGDRANRSAGVVSLVGELDSPVFQRSECPSILKLADGKVAYLRDPPYLHVGIRGEPQAASADAIVVDAWYARGLGWRRFSLSCGSHAVDVACVVYHRVVVLINASRVIARNDQLPPS